jgi:hypothetical protein
MNPAKCFMWGSWQLEEVPEVILALFLPPVALAVEGGLRKVSDG